MDLQELNPSVECEAWTCSQEELCDYSQLPRLCKFSVVVAANPAIQKGDNVTDFAENLYNHGIPFVFARSLFILDLNSLSFRVSGLLGMIRISVKEHFIIDSHEENPKPDLRLDKPFAALLNMVQVSKDTMEMTIDELKHTPYILLFFKALNAYRNVRSRCLKPVFLIKILNDSTAFPQTYSDRKNFTGCLWNLRRPDDKGVLGSENFDEAKAAAPRSVQPTSIPSPVLDILKDPKCLDAKEKTAFWLLSYGLRRFVERHEVLPLSGSLPDMTSDTQRYERLACLEKTMFRYTRLAKIFHEKAQQDAAEVLSYVREAERQRGRIFVALQIPKRLQKFPRRSARRNASNFAKSLPIFVCSEEHCCAEQTDSRL